MTTIKATCPECGDVDLTPADLVVTVLVLPSASPTCAPAEQATYGFVCPECDEVVEKEAVPEVVRLLSGAGVLVERVQVPAEALEAHPNRPLTYDDLLDFALWLERHDTLAADLRPLASG
jgi:predicted RNA-binding Zn-ribbon protein involved in translation (DUF1610 family)